MSALSNPHRHDDLLNYQLKRLVRLGGAPAVRLCEGQFGVARQEWRLIAALVESGPMSPTDLASHTGCDSGRVSRTTKSLMDKRLVERVAEPGDRRRARLAATAAGARLYGELFPQLAAINRRLMAALDDDEAALLEQFLRRLTVQAAAIRADGGGVAVKTLRYLGGTRRLWRDGAGAAPPETKIVIV